MDKYKYSHPFRDTIVIENDRGERKAWSVSALRIMASSTGLVDETREMARGALLKYGLLEEKKPEEEPSSDTIVTIAGIKIYQGLFTRVFFAIFGGTRMYGTLSDIEKKIKKGS